MRMLSAFALAIFASPVFAASFQAAPATAPAAKIVARDVMWRCAEGVCRAVDRDSRASTLCANFVKKAGRVTRFSVDATPFDAAALEKCNASAR